VEGNDISEDFTGDENKENFRDNTEESKEENPFDDFKFENINLLESKSPPKEI